MRNLERPPDSNPPRQAEQALGNVKLVILAGVNNVESRGQNITAAVSHRMRRSSEPRMAIQAAAGAMPSENPRTRWDKAVNRFVKE